MWIQIWTAMITMLLLRYMREIAKYSWNLSNLVGFIRINLFVKMDLMLWLNKPFWPQNQESNRQELLEFHFVLDSSGNYLNFNSLMSLKSNYYNKFPRYKILTFTKLLNHSSLR